jgi:hypothetical protein
VRAAVLEREREEREKGQVEWSPKDVTSGVRLPSRDVGAYGTKSVIDSPPYRVYSKTAKEEVEDPYSPRKDVDVHFKDPFTAPHSKASDESHHEVDPLQHATNLDFHRGSTDSSAYSNSIKSIDEEDAYAGMAL